MKKNIYLTFFLLFIVQQIVAQVPGGFNYQAVLRNNDGELISDQSVNIRISIIDNLPTGTNLYTETHTTTSNSYGIVNLIISEGTIVSGIFSEINWGENDKYLGIEVDDGSGYVDLGTVQLLSVPYALYSQISDSSAISNQSLNADYANSAYSAEILGSEGVYSPDSDTLFVVKDRDDNVVFAVFPDGAEVIVNETAKGKVGGFAVSGRNPSKATDVNILKVTPDSTRIYVNDTVSNKGKVGGFAVSGRNPSKNISTELLFITADSTRIYVNDDQTGKAKVGGFAVSGRNPSKGTNEPMFIATADSTRIFTKDSEGGFGVRDNSSGSAESYLQLSFQNYFIGHQSGINNTSGSNNLFLGYESGRWNNSGGSNVFIGPNAGYNNSTGFGNIFIGNRAGYSNAHIDSSAMVTTEGSYNVYIGYNSGEEVTRGRYNTYVGYATCASGITGEFNTYIGNQAGNQSKGDNNVFLGVKAGELCREGSNNTFLGYYAGQRCYAGSGNVFVGYFAGYGADVDNKLYIDNSSTSSPLIYGDFDDGSELVQINGDLCYTGSLAACSDLRYKMNITPIVNALGIITNFSPVYYYWNKNSFIDYKPSERKQIGLIAQEVEKVLPELVSENKEGYKVIDYSKITPILIESVKEQQTQIEDLKAENKELKNRLKKLEELILK